MTTLLDLYHIQRKLTQGLNDVSGIVWACFHNCHLSHHVCHRLLYIFAIINISQYPKKRRKKKLTYSPNNTSGAVWACFCCIFIDYNCICYNYQLVSQKKKEKKTKNSLMAQTTTDMSFGPIFVTAALPIVYYNIYIL